MEQAIIDYITTVNSRYKSGISREHSYRGDLQNLLGKIIPEVLITNEPARIACGAPDYIITKNNIPIGYIEAKDIGVDLTSKNLSGQFDRYRASLNNLIITDYLNFHLYIDGTLVTSFSLARIENDKIVPVQDNFTAFINLIKNFSLYRGQTITSPKKLAEMMAGKARMLSDVIERSLNSDVQNQENSTLKEQMEAFKQILIHDITAKDFADIYAQTISYGMFAARLHDSTLKEFSRQEAAGLIPKTNPFLRKLFQYVAGYDLDSRIVWIVDGLADIFSATDVSKLLKNFGNAIQTHDPIIHFYETFLSEYDPQLRKTRGVWYTPAPVVKFIVEAVNDILKSDFNLSQGLADTSKIKLKVDVFGKKELQEAHKVQILDPATGTGTFLAEVTKHIYKDFKNQQGIWSNYVENHLIPRLNGFELLMASYAMAHLKLDLILRETGYIATKNQRFKIYLTNSLEEHHPDTGTLFASWLSAEANEANYIKRDTPIMVVMGNPPYSVSSSNKSEWIQKLIMDYKKDLNEKKLNLDDDYIKFIRFGQHFIDKNGEGILAYISNNSFIDGITHRQMRKSLLHSFDKIYILDLHGSTKKKESNPDGTNDQNVFDIMQGVSINLFVKTNKKKSSKLAEVLHYDLYGKREYKYNFLDTNHISEIKWNKLNYKKPYYFFVPKNFDDIKEYEKGFKLDEIFTINNSGVKTDRDNLFIDNVKTHLQERFEMLFSDNYSNDFKNKYRIVDSGSYKLTDKLKNKQFDTKHIQKIQYRPFDYRWIYYDKSLVSRPGYNVMKNLNKEDNYALISKRGQDFNSPPIFISKSIADIRVYSCPGVQGSDYLFPLYLYTDEFDQQSVDENLVRIPNLDTEIIIKIANIIELKYVSEKQEDTFTFAPIDVSDYIYAVLHNSIFIDKYREFLKIDFPRIPYPKDSNMFWQFVKLGKRMRQIHLIEEDLGNSITKYPIDGSNLVSKIRYQNGLIYINETQYFEGVNSSIWNFFIGGYQPAQKWLKDRNGKTLTFEEIIYYQKIIAVLSKTQKIMKEIEEIKFD